jgi:aryl-alcohol dehydrogenase-like predicted oxidoreductase
MEKVRSLHHLAEELHVSLPKLAIAWCLKNPNVSTVILGASKVSQLQETLTSFDAKPHLTDEIMKRIDGIMQNKPVLPEY